MKKFLKWLLKKECIWQNILYRKSNKYIFFSDKTNKLFPITNDKGEILETVKQMLIGYMIEYLDNKFQGLWRSKKIQDDGDIVKRWNVMFLNNHEIIKTPMMKTKYEALTFAINYLDKISNFQNPVASEMDINNSLNNPNI